MQQKAKEPKEAAHGQRMIQIHVNFWTDKIADELGQIIPKHAWAYGKVYLIANRSHGIKSSSPVDFNSLMELPAKIEELSIREEMILRPSPKMDKYIQTDE